MNRKLIVKLSLIISFFLFILCFQTFCIFPKNFALEPKRNDFIHTAGEEISTEEWMNNNDFSTQDDWFFTKGDKGDNSTIDGNISGGYANFKVLGDNQIIEISDPLNDGSWYKYRNDVFLFPDTSGINEDGCYVSHDYDESVNQTRNYHSVHWRRNVTLGVNMSNYIITTASLKAIFNATVNINVDTSNDNFPVQFGIGDFATFYVLISDVNLTNPYRIANNRTTNLGQDSPPILSIPDKELETVEEDDIITALTSSIEKDPDYATFAITLGIDIYCEDNGPPSLDHDTWEELIIKSCNLTFKIERKMEKFTSISVNQIGNTISGADIQITNANLKFNYSIDQKWPTSLSPFSEIRILINDNLHPETIRLSTANLTFEEAKVGGFDLTHLMLKDINITLSIQVYIANTFGLDSNYTISIDDVYLSITYVKTVPDITTTYDIFLNNDNKTLDPIVILPYGVNLNITIKYLEYLTKAHISNATVQLTGRVSGFLNESLALNQYSISVNTSKLGLGVKTLTIVAQKNLYETQNFQFFVEVTERDTVLELYLDNIPKNESATIQVGIDDFINVTVYYKDSITNKHLAGATVSIEGLGGLNETLDKYSTIIYVKDLTQSMNVLIINAQLNNYTPQKIQFFVKIFERTSELQLLLNDEDKTSDPVIELPIGSNLNITVKFADNITGFHITNATIQLEGDSLLLFSTEYPGLEQYSLIINTTILKIGVNLFKLVAYRPNYETQNFNLRITINKISTVISTVSGESQIITGPGQNINLRILLNDTYFGSTIKGAIVTYRWAYGQGNLTDSDNDGIYEAIIDGAPIGTYIITITASGYDNYDFESYDITLSVTEVAGPEGLTWLVYVLIGVIAGVIIGFITYQFHYKYPPMVRKIRKLRKKIRKGKKTKTITLPKRLEIIESKFKEQTNIIEIELEFDENNIKINKEKKKKN